MTGVSRKVLGSTLRSLDTGSDRQVGAAGLEAVLIGDPVNRVGDTSFSEGIGATHGHTGVLIDLLVDSAFLHLDAVLRFESANQKTQNPVSER